MRRTGFKGLVAAGLVATGIAASTTVVAANDIFLKMSGVQGESVDDKHKGEIDVLSWSWGASNGEARVKRGRVPTACIQDLHLTKLVDSASPALIMMSVTGEVAQEAVMVVRKAGKGQQEFLVIKMNNVIVSSYQTGGAAGESIVPTDQVTLHFESIRGEYRSQREDGTLNQPIVFEASGACPQQ